MSTDAKILESPDRPDAAAVTPLLRTKFIGRSLVYKEITESTNCDASASAEAGCADGTVFCADQQSEGRGRMQRNWFSPAGMNLYFSLVLRPDVPINWASSLPLVAGIVLATVIKRRAPELNPRLKWPNDILINQRKVCGILCEMQAAIDCRVRHIIAGGGVNVNLPQSELPADLIKIATSLKMECNRDFSRSELLAEILNEFEQLYTIWEKDGFSPLIERMDQFDALRGRTIQIQQGNDLICGRACGVQDDGALMVTTDKGVIPVYSGETKVVEFA